MPWSPGSYGEGFLVESPEGALTTVIVEATDPPGNPLRLIIWTTRLFAEGDFERLVAFLSIEPDGTFSLPLRDRNDLTKQEVADCVMRSDSRLRWENDPWRSR